MPKPDDAKRYSKSEAKDALSRMLPDTPLVTYAQAEHILGVKRSTVQRLIRRGDLEVVYVTERAPRIRTDSIDRFLRRNTAAV